MNALQELKSIKTESKIDLSELSLEELQDVITVAQRLIRAKEREAKNYREQYATEMLKEGDVIMVTGDKFKDELFEVIKRNPKKVKCRRENGETWNIPYSHILMA